MLGNTDVMLCLAFLIAWESRSCVFDNWCVCVCAQHSCSFGLGLLTEAGQEMWDHCPSNLSSPRSVRGRETDLALRLFHHCIDCLPCWLVSSLVAVKLNISKLMIMWCEIIQVVQLIFPDFLQELHAKLSDFCTNNQHFKMGQTVFCRKRLGDWDKLCLILLINFINQLLFWNCDSYWIFKKAV